jgi:diaminohydroxyphosphoribosylaminopyrimidine deaminase/5-amino-6-(5-phosphoribosylamino)uracil reductase
MKRALALARRGAGWVNPNPMVGAVLVSEGVIIGEGYHEFFGGAHAEVNAIHQAEIRNPNAIAGSTLYVTLEPCNHYGKTPPCTDLIIEKKISKVVAGITDPNKLVSGHGLQRLRDHGILVETGILAPEIKKMNEVFLKYITTSLPFVLLKSAMTLDGKIATVTNASRWITGEPSRRIVHRIRQEMSAVMVGVDTVIYDDPLLNIRLKGEWKQPLKVIADTSLRIPLNAKLLASDPQLTVIATTSRADPKKIREVERLGAQVIICPVKDEKVDFAFLMRALGAIGIDSVLIEGGSTLAFSALKTGMVDKILTFVAPKILGGAMAPTPVGGEGIPIMEDAVKLKNLNISKAGNDLVIEAYVESGLNN